MNRRNFAASMIAAVGLGRYFPRLTKPDIVPMPPGDYNVVVTGVKIHSGTLYMDGQVLAEGVDFEMTPEGIVTIHPTIPEGELTADFSIGDDDSSWSARVFGHIAERVEDLKYRIGGWLDA